MTIPIDSKLNGLLILKYKTAKKAKDKNITESRNSFHDGIKNLKIRTLESRNNFSFVFLL